MDLRTRKSGLSQRQKLQDISFRLRKPKKTKQNKKPIFLLPVQNILYDTLNNNNMPLRSNISNIEASIYYPSRDDGNNNNDGNFENNDDNGNFDDNDDGNFDDDNGNFDDDDDFENNDGNFDDSENDDNDDSIFEDENNDYEFEDNDSDNYFEDESISLQSETQNSKQYDCNDKKFNFSGKAGPYFPNYTHFLLFIWANKYQIGKH